MRSPPAWTRRPDQPAGTLADIVARNAAFAPDKAALRFVGRELSYGALAERIERVAAALAVELGVRRGDRVAVLALNGPDTLVLLYACARLGAMLLPLNWRLAPAELAWILGHAEPRLLAVDAAFAALGPSLAEAAPGARLLGIGGEDTADPPGWPGLETLIAAAAGRPDAGGGRIEDPALLVYTSGTTGRPKGALLTQAALAWNAVLSQHMHGLTAAHHVLTVLPFFHVGGLNIQTTPALQVGATVTIHPRFDPAETLAAIATERPSHVVLVPATLAALLAEPGFAAADLSSLQAITTGSTHVPEALVDPFEERGVPVLQVYGLTETGPVAIYTRQGGRRPAGSTGWPGPFCAARLVDAAGRDAAPGEAGEIWLRGPQLFSGYWRDPAATEAAFREGWFRTGDVAVIDPAGAFAIRDRKTNLVISGGENVYPAEVERALGEHPAVAEAAVVGRPHPRWGEVPVAHVVLRPGQACTADALRAHVAARLARFKVPDAVIFAEALPRNALGKIQHHLLRARHP